MGFGEPFRLPPVGPAHAYQTFSVITPQTDVYWRPATCEDVDCEHFLNGWQTRVPAGADAMIETVRRSGRPYTEHTENGEVVFVFAAGTPCFRVSTHQVRVGRPELFVVRDGDWRGNPSGRTRTHARPADWVEHLHEHLDALETARERG